MVIKICNVFLMVVCKLSNVFAHTAPGRLDRGWKCFESRWTFGHFAVWCSDTVQSQVCNTIHYCITLLIDRAVYRVSSISFILWCCLIGQHVSVPWTFTKYEETSSLSCRCPTKKQATTIEVTQQYNVAKCHTKLPVTAALSAVLTKGESLYRHSATLPIIRLSIMEMSKS